MSWQNLRFYSWAQYLKVFFILEHLKVSVQYQNLRIITDVYSLVKYSNIASIVQLFKFICYLTIQFLLSYSMSHL